jgi:hypothetical protein
MSNPLPSLSPAHAVVVLVDLLYMSAMDMQEHIEGLTMCDCSLQDATQALGERIMRAYESC